LIGVNDAGAAIGLLHDYASLEGDRDKFERHLRGILNNQFGVAFVSTVLDYLVSPGRWRGNLPDRN